MLLLAHAGIRAQTVSFSWDEAWTYCHHVSKDLFFQEAHDKMGGNHHLLNVWSMWLCWKLFGASELALRLPNVLAYGLYLYASGRFALVLFRGKSAAPFAFLLLNAHPYLIDFFSLARGYGLANGFLMVSAWQWVVYVTDTYRTRAIVLSTLAVALACMSHVIMVNFLLAFVGCAGLFLLTEGRRVLGGRWKTHAGVVLVGAFIGLVFVVPNALGLFRGGSLNFGCDTAYWCMLHTLGVKYLYHQPYAQHALAIMTVGLGVVLVLVVLAVARYRSLGFPHQPVVFFCSMLGFCLLSFYLQHVLFGVQWPQTRTALFLVPLVMLILVSAVSVLRIGSRMLVALLVVLCIGPVWNLVRSLNTSYAVEWKPSGEVRTLLEKMEEDRRLRHGPTERVCLGVSFESWGSLDNYYRFDERLGLRYCNFDVREGSARFVPSDYYLVEFDGYDKLDTSECSVVYRSDITNTTLYRNDRFLRSGSSHRIAVQVVGPPTTTRFDADTKQGPALSWVATEDMAPANMAITGTADVQQTDASNWLALRLRRFRAGRVTERMVSTAKQIIAWDEWQATGIVALMDTVMPGDSVVFDAVPCFDKPTIGMRSMRLQGLVVE